MRCFYWVCGNTACGTLCACVHTCMCVFDGRTKRPGSSEALRTFSVVPCQKLDRLLQSFPLFEQNRINNIIKDKKSEDLCLNLENTPTITNNFCMTQGSDFEKGSLWDMDVNDTVVVSYM